MSNKRFSKEPRHAYRSPVIDELRERGHEWRGGRLTLRLAQDFGFCWGVDRAVALVWDAIREQPDRRKWLINEIIHNPKVNEDFRANGVQFVFGRYATEGGWDAIQAEDLVVIPAFSAEVEHLMHIERIGCEVLDTTCPWVEKPHRRVVKYIEGGYTVLVHGLFHHEETRATCSLVESKNGRYVVVRDLEETEVLCSFLRREIDSATFLERLGATSSPDLDPERDLATLGIVNQTTMLASESKEVAQRVAEAVRHRDGEVQSKETFQDFDTICPATQENQDAVLAFSGAERPDLFLVLGGYNSSNTRNLLRAAKPKVAAYHIQSPQAVEHGLLRHRDPESGEERVTTDWLPTGDVSIALTAGASTPDTELADVIRAVCSAAGTEAPGEPSEPPCTAEA